MTATLGQDNPFRYRGYVYDEETGLYYLRSRYYNPEWGRFINVDAILGSVGGLLSHSSYVYCMNNVVNMNDESGTTPINSFFYTATGIHGLKVFGLTSPLTLDPKGKSPKGKHSAYGIKYNKVPAGILVESVLQMVRDGWMYPTKKSISCAWKQVDCISVVRFVGIHFKVTNWNKLSTTTSNLSINDLVEITDENMNQIPYGASPVHLDSNQKIDHIGVHVGAGYFQGTLFLNGVVSSPSPGKRVHIEELINNYWTHYYLFNYINYK